METTQPIYHVEFHGNGSHFYFGSKSAIFELFTPEDIGCSPTTLKSVRVKPGSPYVNKKCIIRTGKLYRKKKG